MVRQFHTDRRATDNSTLEIGGISCSSDNFVVAESSVLPINICVRRTDHCKCAER